MMREKNPRVHGFFAQGPGGFTREGYVKADSNDQSAFG